MLKHFSILMTPNEGRALDKSAHRTWPAPPTRLAQEITEIIVNNYNGTGASL